MKTLTLLLLLAPLSLGCRADKDAPAESGSDSIPTSDDSAEPTDADGDGVAADQDCDDGDGSVFPGAEELCDGLDNDCDGDVDEEPVDPSTWYADGDGDLYGDDALSAEACEAPDGYVSQGGDCDDSDPGYHPGAREDDCADPNDYNCDGSVQASDEDGDGWAACEECDDADPAVNPDAEEICNGVDDDCDGGVDGDAVDAELWFADADGDGYGDPAVSELTCAPPSSWVQDSSDCDDGDPAISPGAAERCDGVDNDCDGDIDGDATDAPTWFGDSDADGYGGLRFTRVQCEAPSGFVGSSDDCDDNDAAVNPGASESCDGVDNDCDGLIDDADSSLDSSTTSVWYSDGDSDGYGDPTLAVSACDAPSGAVAASSDCDDGDAAVNPGATEVCDDVDNDCDALIDDADGSLDPNSASTWYADSDADGFGDPRFGLVSCLQPSATSSLDTDCDDQSASTYPGADEYCDGVDTDCDGTLDEPDALDASSWYSDADADGYGDPSTAQPACSQPSGAVADSSDCDDGDAGVNPGAAEVCDGVDNDCDGSADDGQLGGSALCAATDCAEILADDSSAVDGTYHVDGGGSTAFTARCEMDMDGGGWTQLNSSFRATLSSSTSRRYLYTYNDAWYRSPATTLVWSWGSYQALSGTYDYATSGNNTATGSMSCTSRESGHRGVGCSNGGGRQYKVLPWGGSSSSTNGTTQICQDLPDVFSAGACRSGVQIWVR